MTRVFVSWSGGKDCCLSLYRAKKENLDVKVLANTVSDDGNRSRSHGMSAAVLRDQAEALGISIRQQPTGDENYRERFVDMLRDFRKEGIEGGVFGDIDFNPHREWIEGVCTETGMELFLPLWLEEQDRLMEEFIGAGFISIIVAVRRDKLGPEFLGRTIDRTFLEDIRKTGKNITPSGEAGEYHSLVIDGPIFNKRLAIDESRTVTRDDHHFLEVLRTKLIDKNDN